MRRATVRMPLKRELDRLCRELVFRRDGHRCRKCGATKRLQWSHVHSRRLLSLRWDPMNSMCLCVRCHLFWWHKEPLEAAAWFAETFGPAWADTLRARRNAAGQGRVDLALTKVWLEGQLTRAGGSGPGGPG